jgi:hypothetical protein
MNMFERFLNGDITTDQLRNEVRSTSVQNPVTARTQDMWVDGPADERRLTTYDQRIDSEIHARNNGANPFSAVMLDPVEDQRRHDISNGRNIPNAFANVYLEPYDPVRDRQQYDITNQTGRYELEREQTTTSNAFASVPTPATVNPVGGNMPNPTSDQREYNDATARVAADQREQYVNETYYNPAYQRPLW